MVAQSRDRQLQCFSPGILNLIILPTEACNFRCTYCYETFEHSKMPERVATGIKALIDRRGGELNELDISWFGGEPLLAFDRVVDISQHAIRVAKAKGFTLSGNMTTNGYFLDRSRFESCLENEIRSFQISVDGGPLDHNASRQLASGAGTFGRIWDNLVAIKGVPGDFTILLRLHYTYENFRSVAEFGRRVNEIFGDDGRFQPFFRNIARLGGANDDQITLYGDEKRHEIEAHLYGVSGIPRSSDPTPEDVYICYAAKGNSLVIRSTGRLAKCTVALTDDFNDIGCINENGDIVVDQQKFRRWITPVMAGQWELVSCPVNWVARQAALDAAESQPTLVRAVADA
jgi:uncharacterized protein